METTTLAYLIPQLRRQLSDYTEPYAYTDVVLSGFLLDSIKALGNRWNNRYRVATVDSVPDLVVRNDNEYLFDFSEPPVIQYQDERAVVLQASILIKSGTKWSESGSAVSWRDEEISYSNLESARQRSSTLQDDIDELDKLFPIKLAKAKYGRLKGWEKDWE
ncbi:MAG: hypothetical protein WC196_07480 [Bacilli bacterium]|jgi:hypothetical protein